MLFGSEQGGGDLRIIRIKGNRKPALGASVRGRFRGDIARALSSAAAR